MTSDTFEMMCNLIENRNESSIDELAISRYTPFAQMQFAKEAKPNNIQFLSDYTEGVFGRANGLLMDA